MIRTVCGLCAPSSVLSRLSTVERLVGLGKKSPATARPMVTAANKSIPIRRPLLEIRSSIGRPGVEEEDRAVLHGGDSVPGGTGPILPLAGTIHEPRGRRRGEIQRLSAVRTPILPPDPCSRADLAH